MISSGSIEKYLDWWSDNGGSEKTIRAYRTDLMTLMEFTGTPATWEEMETAASKYLNMVRESQAPSTVKRKLASMRSWARWAGNTEFMRHYRGPKPAKAEPHPLPEGINGVMMLIGKASTPQRRALVALCGLCGLRVDEAVRVRPEQFDVPEMELEVRGKGDKTRVVPVSTKAWDVIRPAYAEAKLSGGTVVGIGNRYAREVITRLGMAAGLSRGAASHDLRATFATAAYENSLDLRAVQELLGHASSDTTEVYTRVSKQTRRNVVEAV